MELPRNIKKGITRQNPAKGKNVLQTKTFVCDMEKVTDGSADDEINTFCQCHDTKSIVLDRHNSKLIYRIVYCERVEG